MADLPETKHAYLSWHGDLRFTGGEPGRPAITIDGDNATAPGPMVTLLLAAGACAGADVVAMLPKMQVQLESLELKLSGQRRVEYPRRYTAIHYEWHLRGSGLDEVKIRRAIDLSIEKYCSVLSSLAPDIDVTYAVYLG